MINVQEKSGIVDLDASTIITTLGTNPSRIIGSSNAQSGLEIKAVYLKEPGSNLRIIWPPSQEFARVLWTVYNGCLLLIYAEQSDNSDYNRPTVNLLQEYLPEDFVYSPFPRISNSNPGGVIFAEDNNATVVNSSEYESIVNEFKAASPNILDQNQILKFSIVRPTDFTVKFGSDIVNDTFPCNTWTSVDKRMLVNIRNYSNVEYTHYLLILDQFSYDQMYSGNAQKYWLSRAPENFSIILDSSHKSLQYGLIKNTSQFNTSVLLGNALFTRLNLTQVARRWQSGTNISWEPPKASTTTDLSVNEDYYAYSILVSTDGINFKYPKYNGSYGGGNQYVHHSLPIIFDTGILNIDINQDQTVVISQTLP